MNIKILVCCHKKDVCVTQDPYLPIHVGHALHPEVNLGIQCDDDGENISEKNGCYCELTGMYWAWKNLKDVDVIGLNHYRRYFDFHGKAGFGLPEVQLKSKDLDSCNFEIPQKIFNKLKKNVVIVAKPRTYPMDVYMNYCCDHYSTDIKELRKVVEETCDKVYLNAFDKVMSSYRLVHYNMFLMRWDLYDKYCQWLFGVLTVVENRINISNYDTTQKRIYGYFAERLFNVYLVANHIDVKQYPILWFFDDYFPKYTMVSNAVRNFRNKVINTLEHPKNLFSIKL